MGLEIQGDRDERKTNLDHHLYQPLGWTLQRRELLRLQHRGNWPLWPHWLQLHSAMRHLQRIRSCNDFRDMRRMKETKDLDRE